MKKLIYVVFLCFIMSSVNAEEISGDLVRTPVDNMYYVGVSSSDSFGYQFKEYEIGGRISYCIEPGKDIKTDNYFGSTDFTVSNLNAYQKNLISLYAFYGDGFSDHDSARYRAATQYLIWEVLGNYKFTFYTGPNGSGEVIDLSYEINEIRNLVNNHNKFPSFFGMTIEMVVGNELVLTDVNEFLDDYEVSVVGDISASVSGNDVIVNSMSEGLGGLIFKYKYETKDPIFFYYNSDSQKMISRGNVNLGTASINVKSYSTNASIIKTGEEYSYLDNNVLYNDILLENVSFDIFAASDIYDVSGELIYNQNDYVNSLVTSDKGYAQVSNLYFGEYYLIETNTSENHILDTSKHYFTLTKDNLDAEISLKNYLSKGSVSINKQDLLTGEVLQGALFGIYTENDEVIFEGTTDEFGVILFENLPIGLYYVKEIAPLDGYILNEDKNYFEITYNGEIVSMSLTNEKIVEIPNTSSYDYSANIALFTTGISFIGMIVYGKRKKV